MSSLEQRSCHRLSLMAMKLWTAANTLKRGTSMTKRNLAPVKLYQSRSCRNNTLNEVELPKAQLERKEPTLIGFFILQKASLWLLEVCYSSREVYGVNRLEEMEVGTDSLYLAFTDYERKDYIHPYWKLIWSDCFQKITMTV